MSSRRASFLMLFALLPMLTYMGHWSPGELLDSLAPSIMQAHDHGSHDHGSHDHSSEPGHEEHHAQHCHGRLISCADVPFVGSATVAYLGASILGDSAALATWRQPLASLGRLRPFEPELVAPPPRGTFRG